jgi:hypothetical protein
VLRTAFPRALVENSQEPKVLWTHLESAIADVRIANQNVGKRHPERASSHESVEAGRRLLGVSD